MLRPALPALLSSLGLCAAACLGTSAAHADPVSDAKDLFAQGRDMRSHGDCAGAVGLFRKAYSLYPDGLGSLRNLAECDEQLGHFASSRREWLDLKRALVTHADPKYDGWAQDADQAAARLAPKLATVTLDVSIAGAGGGAAGTKGVSVTLDGDPIAPALYGTPLERDPGHHVARATGDAVVQPQEQGVDLVAGDAKHLPLHVQVKAAPSPPSSGATPATPDRRTQADEDAENARATKRVFAWIAIGVGGASLVGAGISLGVRQSALSSLNSECGANYSNCQPSAHGTESQGQTASTLVTVFSVLGGVGLVGGIALLATSMSPSQQQAGLVVTPVVAPRYGGAAAEWRF
jgi:hypothetical protein